MNEQDIKELVEFIEEDFAALFEGIERHELTLKRLLDLIKVAKPFFSVDNVGLSVLLRKYCFVNYIKKGIDTYLKRIKLIERIFYSDYDSDKKDLYEENIYFFLPFQEIPFPNSTQLFLLLYSAILERLIKNSQSIKDAFQDLHHEWKDTMSLLKMKISLIFYLPIYADIGDYNINDKILLYSRIPHIKIDETIDDPTILETYIPYLSFYHKYSDPTNLGDLNRMRCYLVYNTEIPFKKIRHNFDLFGKERTEIHQSEVIIQRKIHEIVHIFYLFGFDFNFGHYTIKLPWWFEFDVKELDRYIPRIEYYEGITRENIKELSQLYSDVERSGIFLDKAFEIITYRYHQIYNRDYLPDIIIDSCIILEMLFTRKIKQELKYRLSMNGALFLSSNWEDFKKNQEFLEILYDIRSTIVHGGHWEKKINDSMTKGLFKSQDDMISKIRAIISKILKKLISLKLEDSGILTKFGKKNYFLEVSEIINK